MSSRLDTDYKSCGQMSSRGLRNQSTHTQLLKMMLCLQKTIEDYVVQLKTQHPQQGLAAGGAKAQSDHQGAGSHPCPFNVPGGQPLTL